MKKLIDKLIRWRYLIALVCLLAGVGLNLNGSSLGIWNSFGVSDTGRQETVTTTTEEVTDSWLAVPPKADGTIWGTPRMIRSDEWMVQAPFFISQMKTGMQLVNPAYSLSGQNMILAYNSPVRHLSLIGKPFNWGALFLSPSRALSWYWCFKLLTFLLLAFEFGMIITRKNKLLSAAGAFWITYTPAVQWWFMQHLGDVVWFSLLAMVAIYHFFAAKKTWQKVGFAALLSISLIGFVLVIYPAFQVPFAYLILAFFLIYFIRALRDKGLDRRDWQIMGVTALFTGLAVGYSLWESWDAIRATLGTVYPGSRVSTGGEFSLTHLNSFLVNAFLPFKVPTLSNQVELASSLNFLPMVLILLPFIMDKDKLKENALGLFMAIYSLLLCIYSMLAIPTALAKLTLFSFVPGNRAWQAMSVIAVFASLWFIAYLWREKPNLAKSRLFLATGVVAAFLAILVILDQEYLHYVARSQLLLVLAGFALAFVLALFRWKKTFASLLLTAVFLTGFTVNPIVRGIGVTEDRKLPTAIEKLVNQDKQALWLVDSSMLYNFPQMFGAKTVNGVRFYPDTDLMAVLDPHNQWEQQWNRYAHIKVNLTDSKTAMSTETSPDILDISLNVGQLSNLDVTYVLSGRDLAELFPDQFETVYGPDLDGNRIFRYVGKDRQ